MTASTKSATLTSGKFIFLTEFMDNDNVYYQRKCKTEGIECEKTVFIFPGNSGHHTAHQTLYGLKSGGGLAAAAQCLNRIKVPTLSLPTLFDVNDANKNILAQHAIADLWKALGFGLNLALPVRVQSGKKYFDDCFNDNYEPSFWGGILISSDKKLANYYLGELKRIKEFTETHNSLSKT